MRASEAAPPLRALKRALASFVITALPLALRQSGAAWIGRQPWIPGRHWRAARLVADLAERDPNAYHRFLWSHHLAYAESGALPADGDRRVAPEQAVVDEAALLRARLIARSVATALDAVVSLSVAAAVSKLMDIGFWPVAGVITVMYYTGMTIAFGVLPGLRVVEALRHRLPALFAVADSRRAHA